MELLGNEHIVEPARAPPNCFPLLWVIRREMTHEILLVLVCGQLWPDFRIQLTVNRYFSSLHHLIVPIKTFPDSGCGAANRAVLPKPMLLLPFLLDTIIISHVLCVPGRYKEEFFVQT